MLVGFMEWGLGLQQNGLRAKLLVVVPHAIATGQNPRFISLKIQQNLLFWIRSLDTGTSPDKRDTAAVNSCA